MSAGAARTHASKRRIFLCECQSLLCVLRQNDRFASHAHSSSPILAKLDSLLATVRSTSDAAFGNIGRNELVAPFVEVVKSDETSGPCTAAALTALATLLDFGIIDEAFPQSQEAMSELVAAVTTCRFELTEPRFDEVVKMQIIEVLQSSVCGSSGHLLGDEEVWESVQTCFVNRNQVVHSWTLCHKAEQALFMIVRAVFARFAVLVAGENEEREQDEGVALSQSEKSDATTMPPPVPRSARASSQAPGCYGLPCAVKIFDFLCSQLLREAARTDTAAPGDRKSVV